MYVLWCTVYFIDYVACLSVGSQLLITPRQTGRHVGNRQTDWQVVITNGLLFGLRWLVCRGCGRGACGGVLNGIGVVIHVVVAVVGVGTYI